MAQHRPGGTVIGFLKSRGCLRTTVSEAEPLTHQLMDGQRGGKIVLSDLLMNDFNDLLALELLAGVKHFVIEKRSPVFRLHYDLDFDSIATKEEVERYVKTIVECVASFFDWGGAGGGSEATPAAAPTKNGGVTTIRSTDSLASQDTTSTNSEEDDPALREITTEGGGDGGGGGRVVDDSSSQSPQTWSSLSASSRLTCIVCGVMEHLGSDVRKAPGLHLIFPYLHVDDGKALWIRNGLVYSMMRAEGGNGIDWDKAIDLAVVTKNGLRLVGNDKSRTCRTCRGIDEERLFCQTCNRSGKISENKIYWPWFVYDEQTPAHGLQLLQDMHSNLAYALRMCSIRLRQGTQQTPGFAPPVGAPGPSIVKKTPGRRRSYDEAGFFLADSEEGTGAPPLSRSTAHVSAATQELIQNAIRSFHPAYSRIMVKEIHQVVKRGGIVALYTVRVRGYGCRYCLNKQADHTSQNVYFCLRPSGISQKCWSTKDVQRCHGLCADFCSESKALDPQLKREIFGIQEHPFSVSNRIDHDNNTTVRTPLTSSSSKEAGSSSRCSSSIVDREIWLSQALQRAREEADTIPSIKSRLSPPTSNFSLWSQRVPSLY